MKSNSLHQGRRSVRAADRMAPLVGGYGSGSVITWPGTDYGINVWVWEDGGDTKLELYGPRSLRPRSCTTNTADELLPQMVVELLGQLASTKSHTASVRNLLGQNDVLRDLVAKHLPAIMSESMRTLNGVNIRLAEMQAEAAAAMSLVTELHALGQYRIAAERVP